MKPGACLINVARGGVVNQTDLTIALQTGRLGAAALDVFETEPVAPDDPILKLDNVIVTPHAVCWTDEMFLGTGRNACQSLLDVADGRCPKHLVNREVLGQPQLRVPLSAALAARSSEHLQCSPVPDSMERGPDRKAFDDPALSRIEFGEPCIHLGFLEILQGHLYKDVAVAGFGHPQAVIKLLEIGILLKPLRDEPEPLGPTAFNDRGQEEPIEESVDRVGTT